MIGIEVDWLEGNSSAASKPNAKKQHPEYKSTLSETSRDKWEKITRDGEIVDSFYSLIQPEPNYYNYWCSQVHGLCHEDTDSAPVFPKVWAQIEPLIQG